MNMRVKLGLIPSSKARPAIASSPVPQRLRLVSEKLCANMVAIASMPPVSCDSTLARTPCPSWAEVTPSPSNRPDIAREARMVAATASASIKGQRGFDSRERNWSVVLTLSESASILHVRGPSWFWLSSNLTSVLLLRSMRARYMPAVSLRPFLQRSKFTSVALVHNAFASARAPIELISARTVATGVVSVVTALIQTVSLRSDVTSSISSCNSLSITMRLRCSPACCRCAKRSAASCFFRSTILTLCSSSSTTCSFAASSVKNPRYFRPLVSIISIKSCGESWSARSGGGASPSSCSSSSCDRVRLRLLRSSSSSSRSSNLLLISAILFSHGCRSWLASAFALILFAGGFSFSSAAALTSAVIMRGFMYETPFDKAG
mmetsp:Transcript_74414/g.212170  ORF Transcript_74414/g.212170 Transcript_74414/m.212170 type:complete len:378 (+) Transcript_74414:410-1543(+)